MPIFCVSECPPIRTSWLRTPKPTSSKYQVVPKWGFDYPPPPVHPSLLPCPTPQYCWIKNAPPPYMTRRGFQAPRILGGNVDGTFGWVSSTIRSRLGDTLGRRTSVLKPLKAKPKKKQLILWETSHDHRKRGWD